MIKRIWIGIWIFGCCVTLARAQTSNSLAVSALPAYNWLKYHKADVQSTGDFDLGLGLTFRRQFHKNWQFAIGVNYRKYSGSMDYNGLRDSVHIIDPSEGHKYYLYQIFNSSETQSLTCIEPNIRLEYVQTLSSAVDFIVGVGLVYGINIAENNQMTSGSYRRYAWFYENNNIIENLPSMNLTTYSDFLNPLQGATFKHSLSALGEIGFRFNLSAKGQIFTLLNLQMSLLNIQAKQDVFIHHQSYSGIAASDIPQGVRAVSAGIEIGLSYRFVKTKKRPAMRGVHCP